MTPSVKPLLKWPGGKHKLAPEIAELFPAGLCAGQLSDPFVGSAALFLHLAQRLPHGAVLTDINAGLINFHRMIQCVPDDVLYEVYKLPNGENWGESYYSIREDYNTMRREGPKAAAVLLWLNRTSFNGLYRENKSGGMNAPAGDYRVPALPTAAHVREVSEAYGNAVFNVEDFADALRRARSGDWVYLDPPYDPAAPTASFVGYAKGGFDLSKQRVLAECARSAWMRGASVVASNAGTVRMVELWTGVGFAIRAFNVRRSISCKGEGRSLPVPEILAWRLHP